MCASIVLFLIFCGARKQQARVHEVKALYSGSKYGGWWYNAALLRSDSIVYSFGLGEDTSWDEAILKLGVDVHGFDPTPKASEYVSKRMELKMREVHFTTRNRSIDFKGSVLFKKPANPDFVSMREGNHAGLGDTISVSVNTLQNFMKENGHKYLDILKLDIEGSEYAVLSSLLLAKYLPFTQLLVEFHQRFDIVYLRDTTIIARILECGFFIMKNETGQKSRFNDMIGVAVAIFRIGLHLCCHKIQIY